MSGAMKRWCVATVAVLVLVGGAASAAAESIAISPGGAISATSLGKLSFTTEVVTVSCSITLRGSLHREEIAATERSQIGEISEVRPSGCEGGELSSVLGVPWRFTLGSFLGTLPERLTGILLNIAGAQVLFTVMRTLSCLYEGVISSLLALAELRVVEEQDEYEFRLFRMLERAEIRLHSGAFCPGVGHVQGSFSMTVPPRNEILRRRALLGVLGRLEIPPGNQDKTALILRNDAVVEGPSLTVDEISLAGANPEKFSLPEELDECRGAILPPGEMRACMVYVRYTGIAIERPKQAQVKIRFTDAINTQEKAISIGAPAAP